MEILNLTQHSATPEQQKAGVVDLGETQKKELGKLLTFNYIPSKAEMNIRASQIAEIAHEKGANRAMIGGAPFFMSHLEDALRVRGVVPLYAFSKRESREEKTDDGSTRKVSVFRHLGFVPAK